eukprot:TRINITY_DN13116_c0_g1_i1.p1 TRINITY_DN13116_c0_g1~~TRINITY_DN13116_c0_g1_i1.p1  ORF type:complete len:496 (+),score=118.26 TRINITY_DN13116_c0_g1_i1:201-1688(+)
MKRGRDQTEDIGGIERKTTTKKRNLGEEDVDHVATYIAQFVTKDGEPTGPKLSVPVNITKSQLSLLLNNHILNNDEEMPYSFFLDDKEIEDELLGSVTDDTNTEDTIQIVYVPQAIFKVRAVSRCVSSIEGHSEAILIVNFSPDGELLTTGSGDTTIKLWETSTHMPITECARHTNWVMCLAWAPDSEKFISGSLDKSIILWNREGEATQTFRGHRQCVNALSWEPVHRNPECRKFVSGSKDGTAKVWDIGSRTAVRTIGNHTKSVTAVRWGGEGLIYTASQDMTIKVWDERDSKLVRVLKDHAHWVNTISLNTDYVLRTGAFDHTGVRYSDPLEAQQKALERYNAVKGNQSEILVSGSDDCTAYLYRPAESKKPFERLVGHSKPINIVSFSPDGNLIGTASFDRNVKLWTATGAHLGTCRGHVQEVFQMSWSADSRMIVTGSNDSTLKLWDVKTKKQKLELPGHADSVYSVDWSPNGEYVASGSKDRHVKIWRH